MLRSDDDEDDDDDDDDDDDVVLRPAVAGKTLEEDKEEEEGTFFTGVSYSWGETRCATSRVSCDSSARAVRVMGGDDVALSVLVLLFESLLSLE